MLKAASGYFERMTRGEFARLVSDDSGKEPVLIAQRSGGARIRVEEMSEGTLDQLYLALRAGCARRPARCRYRSTSGPR